MGYIDMDLNELIYKVSTIVSDPFNLAKLVIETTRKLHIIKGIKYRPPGFYEINAYNSIYVLGDLHGDYETLIEFLAKNKLIEKLSTSDTKILFLGDYIDRGDQQIELITFVLLLKNTFPDNIILLRGNHEPPPFLLPHPHDFPYKLAARYYSYAGTLYGLFLQLFQKLAYAARIPGKILFVHGGPPSYVLYTDSFEEAFSIGKPCVDDLVLEEILWNDPIEYSELPVMDSPRGAGVLFGREVTYRALELAKVKYIVRGHEAVNGYKFNHDKKVITLFDSRIEAYGITRAGYLYIDRSSNVENIEENLYLL